MDDIVEFPKVERIVSSQSMSVSQAAAFLSKFVVEQQRKLPSSMTAADVASSPWSSLSSPTVTMTAVDHTVWDDLQSIVRSMKGERTTTTAEQRQIPQGNLSVTNVTVPSNKDSESKSLKKKDKKKKEKTSKAEKREKKRKRESANIISSDAISDEAKQKRAKQAESS